MTEILTEPIAVKIETGDNLQIKSSIIEYEFIGKTPPAPQTDTFKLNFFYSPDLFLENFTPTSRVPHGFEQHVPFH